MNCKQTLIAASLVMASLHVDAACLADAQVSEMASHLDARTPAANPEGLSAADGACTRAKLNVLLVQRYGNVVGYKAGLTTPAAAESRHELAGSARRPAGVGHFPVMAI